jgi:hypothetical protein
MEEHVTQQTLPPLMQRTCSPSERNISHTSAVRCDTLQACEASAECVQSDDLFIEWMSRAHLREHTRGGLGSLQAQLQASNAARKEMSDLLQTEKRQRQVISPPHNSHLSCADMRTNGLAEGMANDVVVYACTVPEPNQTGTCRWPLIASRPLL